MARARNIKPKFFQNDELGELNPLARLLFIGLWTVADFKGCLEYRPRRLKTQILPYDVCSIEELANALDKSGFIAIYSVAGQQYIKILKFKEHQNPHKNEKDGGSDCPDIDKKDKEISQLGENGTTRDKNGTARADSLLLNPDSLFPQPESGIPLQASPEEIEAEQFAQAWAAYPKRPGASRADSLKAWKARIKAGATVDELMAGVERYAKYVAASRTEPQFIKQPETFFGPGKHYESDWNVPRAGSSQLGKAGQATARNAEQWLKESGDES